MNFTNGLIFLAWKVSDILRVVCLSLKLAKLCILVIRPHFSLVIG